MTRLTLEHSHRPGWESPWVLIYREHERGPRQALMVTREDLFTFHAQLEEVFPDLRTRRPLELG